VPNLPDDPTSTPARRLLLVEDDPLLVRFAQRVLGPPEYALDVAVDAESARQLTIDGTGRYDAMLLDVELPGQSGLELLRALRAAGDRTPVLILTGRDTDEDVVRGLDAGADDYLVKPVGVEVLKARLRAAWRRTGAGGRSDDGPDAAGRVPHHVGVLTLAGLTLDRLARRVTLGGRDLDLTPKEFALLEHLLLRPEEVVSRGELLEQVWQLQGDPGSNVVDAHVARLRQKLRAGAACPEIRTVRGVGFRITTECQDGGSDDGSDTSVGPASGGSETRPRAG
jgi:DNA-binding response OmpR family regulator